MTQHTAKKYIGVTGLAAYLAVSANTVRSWVWQRQIPYVKVGRLVRFDIAEVEDWLRERRKEVIDIERDGPPAK